MRGYAIVGCLLVAGGCHLGAPPSPPAPELAFAPASQSEIESVVALTRPMAPTLLRLRWRYEDAGAVVAGTGVARLAPPDSLRMDLVGPLGLGRGTLVLAGDSAWTSPEDLARRWMSERDGVWAIFAVVRRPPIEARAEWGEGVAGGEGDPLRVLRVWAPAPDEVATDFVFRGELLIRVAVRRRERPVATVELTRDASGEVRRAEVRDHARAARLSVEVESREVSSAFPAGIWRRP